MPFGEKWTEEEDALIRKCCAEGFTFEQMSEKMTGRSRGAIAGRASRLNLQTKTRTLVVAKIRKTKTAIKDGRAQPGRQVKQVKPAKASHTALVQGRFASDSAFRSASDKTLPFRKTKGNTLLHVYSRDPYALEPLATYELQGSYWIRRGDPTERHLSQTSAIHSVAGRLI